MSAKETEELWEDLSLVEDWLTGGIRKARARPDFAALEAASGKAKGFTPPASPPRTKPTLVEASAALARLRAETEACSVCRLSSQRKNPVFGTGASPEAAGGSAFPLVLVVGEGPGAEEDSSGLPFVGPAGKLLDKMLGAIGLSRETNAYIANIVKCRPPGNRDPAPDEVGACLHFLEAQIEALSPSAILCLGRTAARALTGSEEGITRLRGRWFEYRGIPLIATFHPSALLRDEAYKRPAWEDLKTLKTRLPDA